MLTKSNFDQIIGMDDMDKTRIADAFIYLSKNYPDDLVLELGIASLCAHAIASGIPTLDWSNNFMQSIASVVYMLQQKSDDDLMPANEAFKIWLNKGEK